MSVTLLLSGRASQRLQHQESSLRLPTLLRRRAGAGHRDRAAQVLEAVHPLVLDRRIRLLLDELVVEAAALHDEPRHDAVEGGVVVVFGGDVFEEVGGGDGGFLRVELDDEFAVGGFEADFVGGGGGRCGGFSGGGFFGGLLLHGGFLFEAGAEEGDDEEGEESVATFHRRYPYGRAVSGARAGIGGSAMSGWLLLVKSFTNGLREVVSGAMFRAHPTADG